MAISEFTIEDLEEKIRDCQKKIVINRGILKEGQISGINNQKAQNEINKFKKLIIYYQRELGKKYKQKYPGSRKYHDSLNNPEYIFNIKN